MAALASVLLLALPGCLTDGSIPLGGGSGSGVLRGVVVFAEDPDQPFAGARVTLRSPAGLVLEQYSDAGGNWQFANVPDGSLDVTFEGARTGGYLPVQVRVHSNYASFCTIAVALEPARMAVPDVTGVTVTPGEKTVAVGQALSFQAAIAGGNPLRKMPTWVVEGGIGSITARGEFTALRPGTGTVHAIVGNFIGSATVTVTGDGK